MKSHYWIKLYHEILDDAKMGRLPDRLWRRAIELFLMAGEEHNDGTLPPVADIAWRLRMTDEAVLEDLRSLEQVKIVTLLEDGTWFVTKFAERQAPMSNAERQRRHRERKHRDQYYGNDISNESVTKCNADVDVDIDVDTDKDVDVDVDRSGNNPFSLYERATAATLTPILADYLDDYITECEKHRRRLPIGAGGANLSGEIWVSNAIREAAKSTNKFGIRYVGAILDRWREEGYDSVQKSDGRGPPKTRRVKILDPKSGEWKEVEAVA